MLTGQYYVFRVRAVQTLPLVRGAWSPMVAHKINAAPTVGGATFVVAFTDEAGICRSTIA